MKNLKNEQGVALVTALLLTMIALAVIMALLYMITWQTKLSAAHKRYKTAIEASQGGVEIFAKQIIPQVFANHTTGGLVFPGIGLALGSSACWNAKLNKATADWGTACGPDASPFDPTQKADMTITLPGTQSDFNVYSKI